MSSSRARRKHKRPRCISFAVVAAVFLLVQCASQAEVFHLKDGTTIAGEVIGYNTNKEAFRVKTSFGEALILKDRILRIVVAEETEEAKSTPASGSKQSPQEQSANKGSSGGAAPARAVPKEIAEHVSGTRYVNETYGFHMFKPPTWRSYRELVTPENALVAALGTPDEKTLLMIGRENYRGSLSDYVRLAENSLKETYRDYQGRGQERRTVAGYQAVEREFTGEAEGRFWTGKAVYFQHGGEYYTILALTAEGETRSFKQALLRKVINTLTFYD